MKKDNQFSEIIIYEGDNGQPRVEVRIDYKNLFSVQSCNMGILIALYSYI